MTTKDALKTIMEKRGVGTNKLADRMGKPPRFISDRIRSKNIGILHLNELLRMLDYKIVLVPRETVEKEDWVRIE
jgi:hypothetical protein